MKWIRRLIDAYVDEPKLQRQAAERWNSLMSAVVGYRLLLTEIRNRARHLDDKVRNDQIRLQAEYGTLRLARKRLWNKLPWSIGKLCRKWRALISQMEEFEALMKRATDGTQFYNQMVESKETLSRRRKLSRDVRKELTHSIYSLVRTIHYALVRERMRDGITQGSAFISIDILVSGWIEELKKIHALKANSGNGRWNLVKQISALRDDILRSRDIAEEVKMLEARVQQVLDARESDVELEGDLASTRELDRVSRIMAEEIPPAWESSNWDALTVLVQRLSQLLGAMETSMGLLEDTQPPED